MLPPPPRHETATKEYPQLFLSFCGEVHNEFNQISSVCYSCYAPPPHVRFEMMAEVCIEGMANNYE